MIAVAALAGVLAACGSGSGGGGSSGTATLRVVNATKDATLTVSLNGNTQFSGVAAASASSFASLSSGNYTVTVASTSAALTTVTQSVTLNSGQNYTLLAYDREGAIQTSIYAESQTAPPSGYGSINVDNLSYDAGPLDVYVTAPGITTLTGLAPTFQYASGSTAPATMVAGTYDIIATAAGNRSDVRFHLSSVSVTGAQVQTLVFTSTPGGALVNGVLITQAGSVQFAPATNARVRVVSALPSSGSSAVAATVGTTSLAPVFAPNPGAYTLVPGDASTYSISVAGAALASVPAATFSVGGDFTILVYGTPSSPLVSMFSDDNHQPTGGLVNLRLVNAAVTAPGGLTLYDNNVAAANSVAYGAASPYVGVTGSSTSVLQLIEPAVAPMTETVALASGSVYTIFVLDSSLTPYIIKDR